MRTQQPKGPIARERARRHRKLAAEERIHKAIARERDGNRCRFPLCGCNDSKIFGMKAALTVSHCEHKGMGGDPTGKRSLPAGLLSLCRWRHQDAPISIHSGMLRVVFLDPEQGCNGPLAFEVNFKAKAGWDADYDGPDEWIQVARELQPCILAPMTLQQQMHLRYLAEMYR